MRRLFAVISVALSVIAGGVLLPGCRSETGISFASEKDDNFFKRAKQLQRSGRTQEALESFLKVISKRSGDAPESHFECGLIYLQHIKDPVAAIYHLRKYLAAQRPDLPEAGRTRDLIATAMKEFARTLPAEPFAAQTTLLDLRETVEKLTKENYQLKEQIAQLRGIPLASRPQPEPAPAVAADADAAPVVPIQSPHRDSTRPAASAPGPSRPAGAQPPAAPAATAAGRVHLVQKSDTLYGISRQYYGNGRRVADIIAANPDLLRDASTTLKPGWQLRIP